MLKIVVDGAVHEDLDSILMRLRGREPGRRGPLRWRRRLPDKLPP